MSASKKWILSFAACLFVLFIPLSIANANENSVYDSIQNPAQQQEAEPAATITDPPEQSMGKYVVQFFGSFVVILILLFLVLRFVSKKAKILNKGSVFHAIGGHSLGNQRSVQMVMVGETLYLLGVGDSVTLIRAIPPGEEQTKILESVAVPHLDSAGKGKWSFNFFKRKTKQEKWDDHFIGQLKDLQSAQGYEQDFDDKRGRGD